MDMDMHPSMSPPPQIPPIGGAVICLRISTVIYMLMAFGALAFFLILSGEIARAEGAPSETVLWIIGVVMFLVIGGFGILPEVAIRGLKQGKRWGWIMGIIIGGLYTPSAFFFLGIPILISLLKRDVLNFYERRLPEIKSF